MTSKRPLLSTYLPLASRSPLEKVANRSTTMTTPTTFWRLAGVSYVQYVSKASSCLRAALKEPAKSKAMTQETFSYNKSMWANGEQGVKTLTNSLAAVGK